MTQFAYEFDKAQIGQIADSSNRTVDSYLAEEEIPFGVAVMAGTNYDKQVKKLTSLTFYLGFSVYSHVNVSKRELWGVTGVTQTIETNKYAINSSVSVLKKGRIFVATAEPVTAGQYAYVHTDGTLHNDPEAGVEKLRVGRYLTSGQALVVLDLYEPIVESNTGIIS